MLLAEPGTRYARNFRVADHRNYRMVFGFSGRVESEDESSH
jgi:hypothetical protein